MRTLSPYIPDQSRAEKFLNILADKSTSYEDYRESFHKIGMILGKIAVNNQNIKHKKVLLCCTNEDADWLAGGILESISEANHVALSVLWNHRHTPNKDELYAVAPVVKTYLEPIDSCDFLIICKSIIYTSCVVRSNIQYLFDKIAPKQVIILSPVIYKGADIKLRNEFPAYISDSFKFIYLAQDDEANSSGEVVPGIGGSIYERIGIGGKENKNAYIPNLVKHRRQLSKA